MDYQRYLLSPHWERTREDKLRRGICHAGYYLCPKCLCFVTRRCMHVHHLKSGYKRLGRERDCDLELACEGCHAKIHDLEPPTWWKEAAHLHNGFSKAEFRDHVREFVESQEMTASQAIIAAAVVLAPRIGPKPRSLGSVRPIGEFLRELFSPTVSARKRRVASEPPQYWVST